MRITVKLFAAAKQLADRDEVQIELPENACIAQLRKKLEEQFPEMKSLLAQALFAVDAQYASNDTPMTENADVACIPPVSGG